MVISYSFGNRIKKSELVYSSQVPQCQAVEVAFEVAASKSKKIEEAALVLRISIFDSQRDAPKMPWLPTKDFLLGENIQVPKLLQEKKNMEKFS